MSICESCRIKGNCCKGFMLNFIINKSENWEEELNSWLKVNETEFLIPRRAPYNDTEKTLGFRFDCSLLGEDGLCKDYENRPDMCKLYQPQEDALCCEYVHSLRGIPIAVESKMQ